MSDHPSIPPGSLLGGKFRIERLLGAGAMGTVYAIDHELTRHRRALKLLHPAVQNIPDIVRRFLNEASAAGRAGNPHLVETFDAGTLPSGEPYVVMELLEGETLGALLRQKRILEPSLAAELVAQAAEGMVAAHRAGIVHRDLKPENLFVTTRDGQPFIKIMDFGVSKFSTGTSSGMRGTQAGMIYGSPAYMSPEQLTAQTDVDGRTDVFALGVVLFECLTGALPVRCPDGRGARGESPQRRHASRRHVAAWPPSRAHRRRLPSPRLQS
jgi:eukaryotic-like serine/threonine-protein kinase